MCKAQQGKVQGAHFIFQSFPSKDPLNQDLMGFFIVVLAFLLFVSFEGGLQKNSNKQSKTHKNINKYDIY